MEKLKDEFIAMVSHELRTPLTSLKGSLGLLTGNLTSSLPPQVRALLEIAHTSTDRLMVLINDIVDLDRVAADDLPLDVRDHDITEITARALLACEVHLAGRDAALVFQGIDAGPRVRVDERRFVQVLSNLLSNAAKFSPPAGTITVRLTASLERIRIAVTDEGDGVPSVFQPHLFDRFTQADASSTRRVGGVGVGLNLARELVTRMNGAIGCDSPPGSGATFWIEFPRSV